VDDLEIAMKKSPLAVAQERFGGDRKEAKAKLVKAVKDLAGDSLFLERLNEEKGLERVSNKKLLHLHDVLAQVKKDFGSRAKLIDAILSAEKRSKDEGYKGRLEGQPTPRLLDHLRAATKRSAAAAK